MNNTWNTKKRRILIATLALVAVAGGFLAMQLSALPQEERSQEIRREYYWDPANPISCGTSIRTCQGYFLKDGCAALTPPPPHFDVYYDPCF